MTLPGPEDIFRDHRAHPHAKLVRSARRLLRPELAGVLVTLHAVRAAAFEGRAADPWVASEEQFQADLKHLNVKSEAEQSVGLVQFTEPLRMADVLPGLLIAARRYPCLPLRLVELGACAGLLLAPVDPCDPGSLDHLRSYAWAGDTGHSRCARATGAHHESHT